MNYGIWIHISINFFKMIDFDPSNFGLAKTYER